jgi:hypothetical protein
MNFRPQIYDSGGVAERLIAPVLKTGRPKGLVSSNLTPSATFILRLLCSSRAKRIIDQYDWQRLFCKVLQRSLNCDFLRITTGG